MKIHQKNKITVAVSDYNREQIEMFAHNVLPCSCNPCQLRDLIKMAEEHGYVVKFITNIFRRLFCVYKYKIIGVK